MANTLTNLIPTLYKALDVVSRELVGFIPAVSLDADVSRAALNQTVRSPVAPSASTASNTPGTTAPDTGDQTIDNVSLSITKSKHVAVRFNGEETRGLQSAGTYGAIVQQRFEQGFRALTNEIETDLAALYVNSSRAYGTAGTTPFNTASDLTDLSETRRILDDNGAPQSDLQMVLGSAAWAKLRGKQSSLFKVNEAGTAEFLREGFISQGLQGFALRNSAQVKSVTKGTGSGYLVNNGAGYAIGATAITVDTGTGTILAGDVITFAGDTNKYVVATALAANVVTLAAPGLRQAAADDTAITVAANHTANMAFHRGAIVLATRLPAMPDGGDAADDSMTVVDPLTGLAFEIALYRQYLQVHYQVRIAWGVASVKTLHTATLLG